MSRRFEQVVATLTDLDVATIWEAATEQEKRMPVEEMLEEVAMSPDHLEVTAAGAPPSA